MLTLLHDVEPKLSCYKAGLAVLEALTYPTFIDFVDFKQLPVKIIAVLTNQWILRSTLELSLGKHKRTFR